MFAPTLNFRAFSRRNASSTTSRSRPRRAVVESRLRTGRQGIQRIYKLAREREMISEYEYLESIGVPRAQALQVMAQASTAFERECARRGVDVRQANYGSAAMSRVVAFLLSSGADAREVGSLVIRHPAVLAYDVEERLKPLFAYMEGTFAIGAKAFVEEAQRRPSLLGLDADDNARKMVEYLIDNGSSKEEAMEYLLKSL